LHGHDWNGPSLRRWRDKEKSELGEARKKTKPDAR
jgi:hypothetical protein